MRLVDLTGEVFGALTVVERLKSERTASGKLVTYYRCRCDCGGEKISSGRNLRAGDCMSCGCIRGKDGHKYSNPRDDRPKLWNGIRYATQDLEAAISGPPITEEDRMSRYRVLGVRRHRMEGGND